MIQLLPPHLAMCSVWHWYTYILWFLSAVPVISQSRNGIIHLRPLFLFSLPDVSIWGRRIDGTFPINTLLWKLNSRTWSLQRPGLSVDPFRLRIFLRLMVYWAQKNKPIRNDRNTIRAHTTARHVLCVVSYCRSASQSIQDQQPIEINTAPLCFSRKHIQSDRRKYQYL